MGTFTVWEKILSAWAPGMTFSDRQSAIDHARKWAQDFADENGEAPQCGRDFMVTQDIPVSPGVEIPPSDNDGIGGCPATLHAGSDVTRVELGGKR